MKSKMNKGLNQLVKCVWRMRRLYMFALPRLYIYQSIESAGHMTSRDHMRTVCRLLFE